MEKKDTFKSTLEITSAIDRLHREKGYGERGAVYRDMLRGIDTMNVGTFVINNSDNKGFTFFTRPCLNLTYSNLTGVRRLMPFRDAAEYSLLRYIRVVLDPWSQRAAMAPPAKTNDVRGYDGDFYSSKDGAKPLEQQEHVDSPLVDAKSPFINVLSNNLLNLTGWPDPVMDYYTGQRGIMGEEHIMADGVYDRMGSFSLEGTFRNTEGNPLTMMMDLWETYMSSVRLGDMHPYDHFIMCQEIDYMTRVYRFVMDPAKKYITMWAACGAGFPVNNPMGTIFNFDSEKEFSDGSQTLNFSFQCTGAMYNDPILLDEFNRLCAIFNPDLQILGVENGGMDNKIKGGDRYVKLRLDERLKFNYCGYPLINEQTYELEWWVPKEKYNEIKGVKHE